MHTRDGSYSSRVVSDGTLRVLALLAVLYDPSHRGVVCFEEPENGVHPARLTALIRHLRALVTDPNREVDDGAEPLSQLLVASHSPVVLAALRNDDVVFADMSTVADGASKRTYRRTRMRSVRTELPLDRNAPDFGAYVTDADVEQYLTTAHRAS